MSQQSAIPAGKTSALCLPFLLTARLPRILSQYPQHASRSASSVCVSLPAIPLRYSLNERLLIVGQFWTKCREPPRPPRPQDQKH